MKSTNGDLRKRRYRVFPILLVICVMPFVTYLHVYEYDSNSYGIYTVGRTYTDFFSYAKGIFLYTLGVYMAYRLIWEWLQGRLTRLPGSIWIPTVLYAALLALSTVFAKNPKLALWGGYQRFEGAGVKLCYLILMLYTYEMVRDEESRLLLIRAYLATAALQCIVGALQFWGHDPIFWEWTKRLIMPKEYRGSELVNIMPDQRIYLTLANPNYASIYFALAVIVGLWYVCSGFSGRIRKCLILLLVGFCFAEMLLTGSRIGLLMLAVAGLYVLVHWRKQLRKHWKLFAGGVFAVCVLYLAGESITDFALSNRLYETIRAFSQERKNCSITELRTEEDAVYFATDQISAHVYFDRAVDPAKIRLVEETGDDISGKLDVTSGRIDVLGYENICIEPVEVDEEIMLHLMVDQTEFYFAYDGEDGYLIYAGNGLYEKVTGVEAISFHGKEHLASGRFYIWSRTIPLLKRYFLFGCGADHFYLVFPQNDYLGKAWYCKTPYTIVEKPHNTFLLIAVEQGIPALAVFCWLFGLGMYRAHKGKGRFKTLIIAIGAAYVCAMLFNDSSVVMMPGMWCCIGVNEIKWD